MMNLDFSFQKTIGKRKLLANGCFKFGETDPVQAVMGPSGVGKSTLMRWIAGLTTADHGFLRVNEQTWFDAGHKINLRPQDRRVGFVAQGDILFPHLTVRQNIGFGLRKLDAHAREIRIEAMLEMTGTSRLAEQKPETLSEGEKRRTVLAQVLATFPRLLILDEPFSGLDAEGKKLLWKQTRSWIESAKTPTILITHDALEAEMFTEKVHLYRAGELRILS